MCIIIYAFFVVFYFKIIGIHCRKGICGLVYLACILYGIGCGCGKKWGDAVMDLCSTIVCE